MYQMGNIYYPIELLRKSVRYFYLGAGTYHRQVVVCCMLGALEWMQRSSLNEAEADWTCCIDEFEELRGWADRDNCREKKKWYAQHRDILRVALFENRNRIQNRGIQTTAPLTKPPRASLIHVYRSKLRFI